MERKTHAPSLSLKTKEKGNSLCVTDNPVFPLIFDGEIEGSQEVINVFLEYFDLPLVEIKEAQTEKELKSCDGTHGVKLDVLAFSSQGMVNLEFQAENQPDLEERGAAYGAKMLNKYFLPGESYDKIPERIVIFFCHFDYLGEGEPGYIAERIFRNKTQRRYKDKETIIFINGDYKGNNKIGKLIADLRKPLKSTFETPFLAQKASYLTKTQEGSKQMSEALNQIISAAKAEGLEEGIAQGIDKNALEQGIRVMATFLDLGFPFEEALKKCGAREKYFPEIRLYFEKLEKNKEKKTFEN